MTSACLESPAPSHVQGPFALRVLGPGLWTFLCLYEHCITLMPQTNSTKTKFPSYYTSFLGLPTFFRLFSISFAVGPVGEYAHPTLRQSVRMFQTLRPPAPDLSVSGGVRSPSKPPSKKTLLRLSPISPSEVGEACGPQPRVRGRRWWGSGKYKAYSRLDTAARDDAGHESP